MLYSFISIGHDYSVVNEYVGTTLPDDYHATSFALQVLENEPATAAVIVRGMDEGTVSITRSIADEKGGE